MANIYLLGESLSQTAWEIVWVLEWTLALGKYIEKQMSHIVFVAI